MWRAFTKQGRMPRCSRISNSGIQYTPVDSSATVVTPHCSSQSVKRSRSSVKVANTRTGFSSRPGRHGYKHFSCANVDTGRIRLQHRPVFQTHPFVSSPPLGLRVRRLQTTVSCLFHWFAGFLSCKQRPSCTIEDTLPNGISWLPQLLTTALRTELGTTLMIGVLTTHHCHNCLLPSLVAPSQDAEIPSQNTSSFPLCPDHRPGPTLNERPSRSVRGAQVTGVPTSINNNPSETVSTS